MQAVSEDLVTVYVPKHLLPEFYTWIGSRWTFDSKPDLAANASPPASRQERRLSIWTEDRLRHVCSERGDDLLQLIRALRSHQPSWRTAVDLQVDLEMTRGKFNGVLSGLTKYMKKHGIGADAPWPFDLRPNPKTGQAEYSLPAEIAERLAWLS